MPLSTVYFVYGSLIKDGLEIRNMADFANLKERLDLLTEIEKDLGPGRKSGRWVFFSCPFPGHKHGDRKPALGVTPANGRYTCFACGQTGDLITWLNEYRKMTWKEISELAGSEDLPEPKPRPADDLQPEKSAPPLPGWQDRGRAFVAECESALWSPAGEHALDWLREKRGLTEETIRYFRLGYNQADTWERRSAWSLPEDSTSKGVWLPRGVVIPWLIAGCLWAVNIRRPDGNPKYYKISGSKAALFGADCLAGAEFVLMTEGEFDAILAHQLVGDVVGVATLGSATKHLDIASWGAYLLPARLILAAYDLDAAGKAGLAALVSLSSRIHPARVPVLQPGDKDITDYYRSGGDLWEWIKYNLERCGALRGIDMSCAIKQEA